MDTTQEQSTQLIAVGKPPDANATITISESEYPTGCIVVAKTTGSVIGCGVTTSTRCSVTTSTRCNRDNDYSFRTSVSVGDDSYDKMVMMTDEEFMNKEKRVENNLSELLSAAMDDNTGIVKLAFLHEVNATGSILNQAKLERRILALEKQIKETMK